MRKFLLTTDTSVDVFKTELNELNVPFIPLTYTVCGETFEDNYSSDEEYKAFYQKLRDGAMPVTSQINSFLHQEFFEKALAEEDTIIHLSLSSGLSATYSSACEAAKEVEKKTGKKVYVIDTLSATQVGRYIFDYAVALRDEGRDAEATARILQDTAATVNAFAIVDDLHHLHRGGRVSGASAYIGSMLKIKPILTMDTAGKLEVVEKAMGTKKAVKKVLDKMSAYGVGLSNQKVYIGHADNIELATEMAAEIEKKFGSQVVIGWVGPIIGAHTGCKFVLVVFGGDKRHY